MIRFTVVAFVLALSAPLSQALSTSNYNTAVSNLRSYYRDDTTGREVISTAVRLGIKVEFSSLKQLLYHCLFSIPWLQWWLRWLHQSWQSLKWWTCCSDYSLGRTLPRLLFTDVKGRLLANCLHCCHRRNYSNCQSGLHWIKVSESDHIF